MRSHPPCLPVLCDSGGQSLKQSAVMITGKCPQNAAILREPDDRSRCQGMPWRLSGDTEQGGDRRRDRVLSKTRMNTGWNLAAPQGFEPRYADPESVARHSFSFQ